MSALPQSPSVSAAQYRSIFRSFPAGVSVVTTRDLDGTLNGLTATSVCSLSLEPPLLLVCIAHDSTTLPALQRRRRFVVNFLSGDGAGTARRFASDLTDKFAGIRWRLSDAHRLPILVDDSVAYAECRTVDEMRAGDHTIVVGLIEDGAVVPDRAALVFRDGVFGSWPAETDPAVVETNAPALVRQAL